MSKHYDSVPSLTIDEKNNMQYLSDNTPGLIIEGKSDFKVYGRLFLDTTLANKFDFVIGSSKPAIKKAYNNHIIKFPYVIILDKDYDGITDRLIDDEYVLYTEYYTMENYLTIESVVNQTNKDFASIDCNPTTMSIIKELNSSIRHYVFFCLLKLNNHLSIKFEDCDMDRWIDRNRISDKKIRDYFLDQLKTKTTSIKEENFDQLFLEAEHYFNSLSSHQQEEVTHGKIKLKLLFYIFKDNYPNQFKNRDCHAFFIDLLKNIHLSEPLQHFFCQIETKLNNLISPKTVP